MGPTGGGVWQHSEAWNFAGWDPCVGGNVREENSVLKGAKGGDAQGRSWKTLEGSSKFLLWFKLPQNPLS